MKQEPVAWMMVHCENGSAYLTFEKPTRQQKITHTPHELYTAQNVTENETKCEPVAWMRRQDGRIIRLTPEKVRETDEPLYTSPQHKELSDDEIDSCAYFTGMWCDGTPDDWDINTTRNFARAILRKAQEK